MTEAAITTTEKALRWKSRRGWLELDLTLQRFWQLHGGKMSQNELKALADWLAMDDPQLWDFLQQQSNANNQLAIKIVNGE